MRDTIVYPAEGYGAHIRSVTHLADKVNNPLTCRFAWKASPMEVLPIFQLCSGDDTANVITFTEVTIPDPRVTVDVLTGEVTFNDYFKDLDLFVALQGYRQISGGTTSWGFSIETLVPLVGWVPIPDSTRHLTFRSQDTEVIQPITYSVSTRFIQEGSKFRFVQSCSDASKNIGLISSRPLMSLPQAAGAVVSLAGR